MALLEVDADQYAAMQRELAQAKPSKTLLDKLAANKTTRHEVLKLVKQISPETPIPELDANQPVLDAVAKEREERLAMQKRFDEKEAAEEKKARESRVNGEIDAGRQMLTRKGYSAEAVTKVEELMNSRGLADYEAAEALFAKTQPTEDPMVQSGYDRNWNGFNPDAGDDDHKLLMQGGKSLSGAKKFVAKTIQKTLAEMRGQNRLAY